MVGHATEEKSCGKQCCHVAQRWVDSAAAMEHMIPRHPQLQRNGVFCWVCSEAISLDWPSWVESSAVRSQLVQLGSFSERGHEAMNMEVEGYVALEAITRQLVNTQQTEKT
jgi:hypothetical protein